MCSNGDRFQQERATYTVMGRYCGIHHHFDRCSAKNKEAKTRTMRTDIADYEMIENKYVKEEHKRRNHWCRKHASQIGSLEAFQSMRILTSYTHIM